MKPISNIIVIILIIILSTSCKIPKVQIATSIELYSGGSQRGEVKSELAKPIEIIIKDQDGDFYAGKRIEFSVIEGDVISAAYIYSDYEGKAKITWKLGYNEGIRTLSVIAYENDLHTHLEGSPLEIYAEACPPSDMTDIDGNIYKTILINKQIWMAEDLKVTHYPDGTVIPNITDNNVWSNLTEADKAYCFYNNDPNSDYGALYTWAAVMSGEEASGTYPSNVQGVCPDGWHIPSYDEWRNLIYNHSGKELKEAGNYHWYSPSYATNESGFTALPGGKRLNDGSFNQKGYLGRWWTSSIYDSPYPYSFYMVNNDNYIHSVEILENVNTGLSVRCIKN